MNCFVYILYNEKFDKFYIGTTYSLQKRMFEHNNDLGNYTRRYDGEWLLVYSEKYPTRGEAMKREKYFKSLKSKVYLKAFIKRGHPVG